MADMERRAPTPLQDGFPAQSVADSHNTRFDFQRNQHDADNRVAKSGSGSSSVESVVIGASGGQVTLYHGLGRIPQGFRIIDITCSGTLNGGVKRAANATAETIVLQNDATSSVVVKVEVF